MTLYESFFGLARMPFGSDLPVDELFRWQAFNDGLAYLTMVVNYRRTGILTGDPGTGKSTILRTFVGGLKDSGQPVIYIAEAGLEPRAFNYLVLTALGVEPKRDRTAAKKQLRNRLLEQLDNMHPCIIIIDEAQLLAPAMLEELRLLTNACYDSVSPAALLLVGQTELRTRLTMSHTAALSQRVGLRCHLNQLTLVETKDYIGHHLKVSGATRSIFTEQACGAIHQHSHGLCRVVNNLATTSLLIAYQDRQPLVDDGIVGRARAALGM